MKLMNKVAFVTGASKGIGKAIARKYAEEGAAVVLASRTPAQLERVAEEIAAAGGRAFSVEVDVRSARSIQDGVDRAVAHFGSLDIMVNNAGVTLVRPSEEVAPEEWSRVLETDLFGVFYGCQSAARQMMRQGGGSIINITSMFGLVAAPQRATYCVSKAGANMLTKVLAVEWAKRNIRVNAIAPGYIRTELVQDLVDQGLLSLESLEKRTPQGRIGEVQDLLSLAVYLAAEESSLMTGSVLTIDGGWTAYGFL